MLKIAIFLDTGFYLGLCHPKDKYAKECEEIFKRLGKGQYGLLYTSSLIISEITTLIAVRTNSNPKVLNLLESFIWGKDRIATSLIITPEFEFEAWNLFQKVNTTDLKDKRPMSFVDITSVKLCKQHQIDNIVSFDSHFDQFLNRIYQ